MFLGIGWLCELVLVRELGAAGRHGARIKLLLRRLCRRWLLLLGRWGRGTARLDELLVHSLVLPFGDLLNLLAGFIGFAFAMLLTLRKTSKRKYFRTPRSCSLVFVLLLGYLLFLLLYEFLLVLHPEVVEVIGISVEFQTLLLVLSIRSELVQVRGWVTSPNKVKQRTR